MSADQTAIGCGQYSRDELELAALARADAEVPVPAGVGEHIESCPVCRAIVDRFAADNAFLGEFVQVGRSRESSRSGSRAQAIAAEANLGPIAGYRLGDEIHRGGQGAVYRAEQLATRRTCAVKMLLRGRFASDRELVRFEREVEVVARMRHPSIVTLYESGVSRDDEPWFAMELVDGERLDVAVRARHASPREIAQLVKQVAEAVAYAHRRGVIHRDLKPGNILVDKDGVPRVLDFGLARADEDGEAAGNQVSPSAGATRAGEFLGTFAYAAPEQLAGDPNAIDTRCDLYALGVVLYECLAGRKPFEGARSIAELVEQKTHSAPERPSARNPAVDRDLDVIALRLLAADPARRYDTADALVEDLARYLDGRPILAREDSTLYVVGKTLRRHWLLSSTAAVLLVTIVASGIALAVAYARAERERARSERTLQGFREALGSANPESGKGSADISVDRFLGLIEENASDALKDEPNVLAGVLDTIGIVHLGFDDAKRAEPALQRALDERRELFNAGGCTALELAESLHNMGRLLILKNDLPAAEAAYREALAIRERDLGRDHRLALLTGRHLASCLRREQRIDEALAMYDALFRRASARPDYPPEEFAALRNGRAFIYFQNNQLELSLAEFTGALEAVRRATGTDDDYRVGRTLFSIARVEDRLGRRDDALMHATAAQEILRKRKGGDAATVVDIEKLVSKLREPSKQ